MQCASSVDASDARCVETEITVPVLGIKRQVFSQFFFPIQHNLILVKYTFPNVSAISLNPPKNTIYQTL